jgi:hypothetical protein
LPVFVPLSKAKKVIASDQSANTCEKAEHFG